MKINVEYAACYYKVSDFQARVSRNLLDFTIRHIYINRMPATDIESRGGGGTAIYGLYRYVPL